MIPLKQALLLSLPVFVIAAADQPWKDKLAAQWTEEEAKQVLTDSPWARQVTPTISRSMNQGGRGRGGGMGRGGGIGLGIPGVGIGMPGGGMGRRGGGYPQGGEYPQDEGYPQGGGDDRGGDSGNRNGPPTLTVRWESALPVQQAELKTKVTNAPTIDQSHYAIVVTGLPARMANAPKMSEKDLKGQAELKKDGKKFAKPSDVRVLSRDEGLIIVYYFPRSKEVTKNDKEVALTAHIGRFEIYQTFYLADMTYNNKLEL